MAPSFYGKRPIPKIPEMIEVWCICIGKSLSLCVKSAHHMIVL